MHWKSFATPFVTRAFLLALPVLLVAKAVRFHALGQLSSREMTDFDAFYVAGQLAWRGEMSDAYRFATMGPAEAHFSGTPSFLPWTYPPPFNLLVATFACVPEPVAYLVFSGLTLGAFLLVLRRIAADAFPYVLLAFYPSLLINLTCGQNGGLTGLLIGLICMGSLAGSWRSGLPLGCMIIKPHLAVAIAVQTLASKGLRAAAAAAATAGLLASLATAAFGTTIWPAFFTGVAEAKGYLAAGAYPLVRMTSTFAALRSLGVPASFAGFAQALVAFSAIAIVIGSIRARRFGVDTLGLAVILSLTISPYVYDYDLTVAAVGLALLAPRLLQLGTPTEQTLVLIIAAALSGYGVAATLAFGDYSKSLPALGGIMLLAWIGLIMRVLSRKTAPAHSNAMGGIGATVPAPTPS